MAVLISDQTITRARTETLLIVIGTLGPTGLAAFTDARFTAKRDIGDADALAIISKSLGAGVTVTATGDATTNGVLSVALAPSDTAGLPVGYTSTLVYDVTLYDMSGDDYTVASGILTVTPTATQATT